MSLEGFLGVLSGVFDLLNMKMNIYGFVFSFWDVIMFVLILTLLFSFVRRTFYDN